ncbi:DUF1761 domain-containing protein [Thalassobacillus hwangdonensis]|uniref:DUF1761 domain-containing protein n=1 Tax=Thalassobacillus hwangdonensis TaxID=546108 RepID=A0ABW3L2U2_9BACI
MFINFGSISYLALVIGAVAYMVYGGIYYSVVLSSKKESNKMILGQQSSGPFKYIYSVILAFISSFFMAILIQSIGPEVVMTGAVVGFMVGLLLSLVYLKNTLFGLLSGKSCMIAIGDHLVAFTLLGFIHGLFI